MKKVLICVWSVEDTDYNCYETDCGKSFILNDGDVKDNELIYCCFCGKKIEEEKIE